MSNGVASVSRSIAQLGNAPLFYQRALMTYASLAKSIYSNQCLSYAGSSNPCTGRAIQ